MVRILIETGDVKPLVQSNARSPYPKKRSYGRGERKRENGFSLARQREAPDCGTSFLGKAQGKDT